MTEARWLAAALAFLGGALTLAGCTPAAPPTFDFKGAVINKGAPLDLKGLGESKAGPGVQVWLVKQDGDKLQKQATVNQDGTFVFGAGNKPTAGKYKITVKWQDNFPMGADKLKGKFDEKNSKVFCTIPDDTEITIDVGK